MIALGSCSQIVSSPLGLGWFDAERWELRTPHGIYLGVRFETRAATEAEARDFYATSAAVRAELSAYYAAPGDKGD